MTRKTLKNKSVSPNVSTGNKKRRRNKKQDASITNVNFSDYAANRYFANRRVVMGVRVDEGLAKRFKQVAKQCYGSVCRAVEVYMVNFIEATERGVNFCYTSKPLHIDKVVIERNLRPRRKLVVDESMVNDKGLTLNDGVAGAVTVSRLECAVCGGSSYGRGTNKDDSQVWLCRKHFLERKRCFKGWLYVKESR